MRLSPNIFSMLLLNLRLQLSGKGKVTLNYSQPILISFELRLINYRIVLHLLVSIGGALGAFLFSLVYHQLDLHPSFSGVVVHGLVQIFDTFRLVNTIFVGIQPCLFPGANLSENLLKPIKIVLGFAIIDKL